MTGERLIFAGGAPRSGLTLLRAILNAHPRIFCGPDSGVAPGLAMQWRDFESQLGELHATYFDIAPESARKNFADAIEKILLGACAASERRRVAEKTPLNVLAFESLAALFPKAKFIHVVRDGRDVVASLLERDWRDPHTGAPFAHVTDAEAAAAYWSGLAAYGCRAEKAVNDAERFYHLQYETLAARPKRTLRALFDFLGEPFDPAVLRFYENDIPLAGIERDSKARLRRPIGADRVGRWRNRLTPPQREAVESAAGAMLRAFNYL